MGQYTHKEILTAVKIIGYCNGTHTRQEIKDFIDKIVKGLTDQERENIYDLVDMEYKRRL